jgi:membrane protease subunit HflC
MNHWINKVFLGALVLFFLYMSAYTVPQTKTALVFQLGELVEIRTAPGLYFKIPLIQSIQRVDNRIQTIDYNDPQRFITAEKKPLLVDYFVKWRILDPKKYFLSVGGDLARAQVRITQTVNDDLRAEFAKRTVHEAVSGERSKIMDTMRTRADQEASFMGVQVIDVRIRRIELTQEVSDSVYRRMEAERKRVANELRSTGYAQAEKIRATADRDREVILAEAYREAQQLKGQGDGKASVIYSEAYGKNPEFYAFYKSLESYRKGLASPKDVMVLEASSPFFKYFNTPPSIGGK